MDETSPVFSRAHLYLISQVKGPGATRGNGNIIDDLTILVLHTKITGYLLFFKCEISFPLSRTGMIFPSFIPVHPCIAPKGKNLLYWFLLIKKRVSISIYTNPSTANYVWSFNVLSS